MPVVEEIYAFGHKNILCTHKTTIELTKKNYLTKRGNCILGINASKSCESLDSKLKYFIRKGYKIKVIVKSGNLTDSFYGFGNKSLTLLDKEDLVFRKSNFICDRTVLINCNKASIDLKPNLIEKLKNPSVKFSIIFEVDDNK
ncbi:MAG: DUF371 domain-containing protein [Candidatus Hermodarchaeota archaeon]